jgi:hypothetical protein
MIFRNTGIKGTIMGRADIKRCGLGVGNTVLAAYEDIQLVLDMGGIADGGHVQT